jgi:hypothetical protein
MFKFIKLPLIYTDLWLQQDFENLTLSLYITLCSGIPGGGGGGGGLKTPPKKKGFNKLMPKDS